MKILHIDENHPLLLKTLNKLGHENTIAYNISKKEILYASKDYDGIVIRSRFKIDKEFIDKSKKLKFIARVGSGIENIDQEYARTKKIKIISAPKGNSNSVGEHAIGMLLALLNKLRLAHQSIQKGHWHREEHRGDELEGKVVGIIGYGNTGKSFAKKLIGFDVKVIFYDIKKTGNDMFAQQVSITELQKRSHVVSLHIPETNLTTNMFNKSFISKMKNPFWLINTARGKALVVKDLIWGLENKKILGAALDVLEYETKSFEKLFFKKEDSLNYLLKSDKILLSPHVAGWSFESHKKLAKIIVDKISKLDKP